MGELLSFEEHREQRLIASLVSQIGDLYGKADEVAFEFSQCMEDDPISAITLLPTFIRRARDVNPDAGYMETLAGGPNHDWIAPLLNIVGVIYPELELEPRTQALKLCLNYFDGLNYDYVQNHVELLNEPWLVGDIVINRWLYNCGYKEYIDLLEQNKTWKNLIPHLPNVKSAFWLAYTIVHTGYASPEIKRHFYKTYPTLTDRTLDTIAGRIATNAQHETTREGSDLQDNIEKRLFRYDNRFYHDLVRKIDEKKWIIL